jgi:hypothetical protein
MDGPIVVILLASQILVDCMASDSVFPVWKVPGLHCYLQSVMGGRGTQ